MKMKTEKAFLFIFILFCKVIAGLQAQTVKDIDGNIYKTVTIGDQVWMAENLKTTKFNDGTSISLVTSNKTWSEQFKPGYCWYNNNQAMYKNTYGALYNAFTVIEDNLCPTGWHVPNDDEWTTLIDYLDGLAGAGGKLKEKGTNHWKSPNIGSSNETGFTALPGGYRYNDGTFFAIGSYGLWWIDDTDSFISQYLSMAFDNTFVYKSNNYNKNGFSVRCVKGEK